MLNLAMQAAGVDGVCGNDAGPQEPFSSPQPTPARQTYKSVTPSSQEQGPGGIQGFLQSELPGRLGLLLVSSLSPCVMTFLDSVNANILRGKGQTFCQLTETDQ